MTRVCGPTLLLAILLTACGRQEDKTPVVTTLPAPKPVIQVMTPPPVPPQPKEAFVLGESVARLEGSKSADVTASVSGYLIKQVYADGASVRKGDVLFLLDAKAPGALHDGATVKDPVYTKVPSPMAGVADAAIPGVGDFVEANSVLARVEVVDPIRADFIVTGQAVDELASGDVPDGAELLLQDGTVYPPKGHLFLGNKLTKNGKPAVEAYALFPNPSGLVKPGDYVKVRGTVQK